jgi:hypothetical protein
LQVVIYTLHPSHLVGIIDRLLYASPHSSP